MIVPFICNQCDDVKSFCIQPNRRKCVKCGGVMEIHYQDNYENVAENIACNTCVHNTVGAGEKCSYCNQI